MCCFLAIADGCGSVRSAVVGQNITLELPHLLVLDTHTHDHMKQLCVWVLKVPRHVRGLYAYARFTQLDIYGMLTAHQFERYCSFVQEAGENTLPVTIYNSSEKKGVPLFLFIGYVSIAIFLT